MDCFGSQTYLFAGVLIIIFWNQESEVGRSTR
jgi:hypothetical protein